ncbi:glycosyltransferase family 2 protein [Candidatus Falkowbacteria bacterium]|jgi:GT2 family glycosyltransferase|nr:glycosyltransferase family 2 protein [Candidatus Falkowbacteria bacterium]MBT5502790.1 glycosyltransferase family 2 protein [Candidatus Falkowbacteria bacterium]MBT7348845.1 glycosyltransferase family 2 protein [Candidatus Falkowbacteria bacterium]MBT7500996.1 glycosyltransferase family 2 protein [Candidatus Falkowbacteria bacterium]
MSKVSINLVTWNGARYIESCLKSVLEQTFKDVSLIIIDNGSTDNTLELINERYPHLKVIKHKDNLGFAKAHNQAIHWTKSDYVLCLNQDVVLEPGFVQELVEFMDNNPMAGVASGKVYRWQDGEKTKYIDTIGLKIFKNFRVIDMGSGEVDEGQYDLKKQVFGISGALPFFRRKALEEIRYQQEYFDESFFSYKEDVDLAFRLQVAGWEAWMVPGGIAYHDRTVTIPFDKMTKLQVASNRRRKSQFANFYSYRNHIFFLIKCLPKLSLRVFLYELVKFFYVFLLETKNLKAWIQVIRNWKQLKLKRKIIWKNKKIKDEELSDWFNS